MLFDHVDLRVSDLAKVRPLYDALLDAMGYTWHDEAEGMVNYHLPGEWARPFFGLMVDPAHRANGTRIAFIAESREEVDRLATVARDAGATAFEAPEDYGSPQYYAAFFEDVDGNRLEICYRV